jgi:hypothetical protein
MPITTHYIHPIETNRPITTRRSNNKKAAVILFLLTRQEGGCPIQGINKVQS